MHTADNLQDCFMGSVTVGERGQVVIPARARELCGVHPGDRLLCFMHDSGGGVIMVKVSAMNQLLEELNRIADTEGAQGAEGEGEA